MLRKIIKIDEGKCDGCRKCIPACHEGALQVIDGKCRLVSDLFCDGLGACIGECPQGALEVIEAEAVEYNEVEVIKSMLNKPQSVLKAHLSHLLEHSATGYFNQAAEYLSSIGIAVNIKNHESGNNNSGGCPGSAMKELKQYQPVENHGSRRSMLSHWPIQLHLVNPNAPFLQGRELVIMATCVPVAYADTHTEYLNGRAVVIACPKLDYTDPYPKKLEEIFRAARINKAIVVRMEVPCCSGLSTFAMKAAVSSGLPNFELHEHTIGINGEKVSEKILFTSNNN